MEPTDITRLLEEVAPEALRDDSGVLPEATLDLQWPMGGRGTLVGSIPEGASEPEGGVRTQVVDITLTFDPLVPERKAREAVARLANRLAEDPALEEQLESHIEVREPRLVDNDDGEWVGTLTIALSSVE